jgi:hypothetical protein
MPRAKVSPAPASPLPAGAANAEQWAREVRELCLHASGDAGLALCELLHDDAGRLQDGGRLVGSTALPPSAWKVLVRLMEEWVGRGERTGKQHGELAKQHDELAGLRRKVQNYGKGPASKSAAAQEWRGLARRLWDGGTTDPKEIRKALAVVVKTPPALHTVQNYLTKIRRGEQGGELHDEQ